MKFDRLYSLLCEESEISKNIAKRNPKEIWKVAQDIRQNIQDYPDVNLAEVYGYKNKFTENAYLNHTRLGRNVYFPYEKSIFRIPVGDFERVMKKKGRYMDTMIKSSDIIGYLHYTKGQAIAARQLRDLDYRGGGRAIAEPNPEISDYSPEDNLAFKKWKHIKRPLTTEEKNHFMKVYKIGTPQIYKYLLETTYKLPKHPTEFPKEMHDLPRVLLDELLYMGETPVQMAEKYSRATDWEWISSGNEAVEFYGFARVLDIESNRNTNYPPTRKEAMQWLSYISEESKYIRDNSSENHRKQGGWAELHKVYNFPSWFIRTKIDENENIDEKTNDFSFQSWMVFRWFVQNMNSTYLYKDITVHGPAGAVEEFLPLDHLSKLLDVDLVNGIKTSPEVAFQAAARRQAKEFEEANKEKEFVNYGKEYKDTEFVKVIRNSTALKREGQRMKHCVGGYGPSCLNGSSLILSLPKSTAELDPRNLQIFQHRGWENEDPPQNDRELLRHWIQVNNGDSTTYSVRQIDDKWYYYDEEDNDHGPFYTREEAIIALKKYEQNRYGNDNYGYDD